MKTLKTVVVAILLLGMLPLHTFAQEDEESRPAYVTITRVHANLDNDEGSEDEWMELEKKFFDNVIAKNEHIAGAACLLHYYTGDNSELLWIQVYNSWEDLEKAQSKNGELIDAAWPDEDEREAFFAEQSSYYTGEHSDEIYATMGGAKIPEESFDEQMVVYVQKSHWAFPDDGSNEEYQMVREQYEKVAYHKNEHVQAFYPVRHAWGADNREKVDFFFVNSLADVERMNARIPELIEEHWADEEERDAFFEKYDKYYTGWHGDFIYRSVPELSK